MTEALFRKTFARNPQAMAAAPGRLEFIGNHTDYNGGHVIGVAINAGVRTAVALTPEPTLRLVSENFQEPLEFPVSDIAPQMGDASWTNYVLGVVEELKRLGFHEAGFQMAVTSDLAIGAGMSSSAALELAAALPLAHLSGISLDQKELARLCRRAENDFVGMPCGILDQGVSAFGKRDHLVKIDCRGESFGLLPLPSQIHFWVFNSGKKHSLLDSLYAERHRECMTARDALRSRFPEIEHLCDATHDQVAEMGSAMSAEVYRRARHVVSENQRVLDVEAALREGHLEEVGKLMFASHESSRLFFENSVPELDFLVDALADEDDVFGARLTGGGFGGAVMAMTTSFFSQERADAIAERYAEEFGHETTILHMQTGAGARLL